MDLVMRGKNLSNLQGQQAILIKAYKDRFIASWPITQTTQPHHCSVNSETWVNLSAYNLISLLKVQVNNNFLL